MKIHHLNCATMCPASARLVNGEGGLFQKARMICHCLLIESNDGLVLVDTGLGTDDVRRPKQRLGTGFLVATGPVLDEGETALRRVEALGFQREDVRHIVVTHLDLDHAGGLPDFPAAKVHVYGPEHAAATARATLQERERYRACHFEHGPAWVKYEIAGDQWNGFEAVRAVPGSEDEILIVPVVGHTRGHACIAVREGDGYLLHCGDAYFNHREMDPHEPSCPPALAAFQRLVAMDDGARRRNQERLRQLAKGHPEVRLFSAHDPVELERF